VQDPSQYLCNYLNSKELSYSVEFNADFYICFSKVLEEITLRKKDSGVSVKRSKMLLI
jgi:hypothetical protein